MNLLRWESDFDDRSDSFSFMTSSICCSLNLLRLVWFSPGYLFLLEKQVLEFLLHGFQVGLDDLLNARLIAVAREIRLGIESLEVRVSWFLLYNRLPDFLG